MGRTFQESFQKALRGLEVGVDGMNEKTQDREVLEKELGAPGPDRIWYVGDAFAMGMSVDEVFALTKIDPWFLVQIEEIVKIELELETKTLDVLDAPTLRALKKKGFSDRRLARHLKTTEKVKYDEIFQKPLKLAFVVMAVEQIFARVWWRLLP